jgi:hypothetical protein
LESSVRQANDSALEKFLVHWERENPVAASEVSGSMLPVLEILSENKTLAISELVEQIEEALRIYEEQQTRSGLLKKASKEKRRSANTKKSKRVSENISEKQKQKIHDETSAPGIVKRSNSKTVQPVTDEIDSIAGGQDAIRPETIPKAEDLPPQSSAEAFPEELAALIRSIENPSPQINSEAVLPDEDHPMLRKKPFAGMTRFAGLALIAPFLPAFFTEMKLVTGGKFIDEVAQHKAVHLLNYIATGKMRSPEYALLLHKLICGLDIIAPLPKSMKLSADEKKESLLLLDDIAEQWTALRGTSGETFRNTFMRRNGIIERKENAWLLRVERAPVDIMIGTLPWSISIIKAPWMQQLLHVEW